MNVSFALENPHSKGQLEIRKNGFGKWRTNTADVFCPHQLVRHVGVVVVGSLARYTHLAGHTHMPSSRVRTRVKAGLCGFCAMWRTPCESVNLKSVYPRKTTNLVEHIIACWMSRACPPFLQFLAMVRRHVGEEAFDLSASPTSSCASRSEMDAIANKVGEVFKQMDVRGDGEVSWEDFSAVRLQ